MSAPKLCKDCKWMRDPGEFAKCEAPQNMTSDIRTGFEAVRRRWTHCNIHREGSPFPLDMIYGLCGNSGRWWEAK